MSDLISRQAAIDVADAVWSVTGDKNVAKVWDQIKDLPSAQPKQQWIPVSERLPKKDGRYLVTRYDYVTSTEFIDILWYEKNLWWNMRYTGNYAVTAWMPLPEPYKGEDHEQN